MEGTSDPLEDPAGSELGRVVLRPNWQELQEASLRRLDAGSIEDLCDRARDAGGECRANAQFDFMKIGSAHVCTLVTNAHIVCRLLLDKKKQHRLTTGRA